jgi:ketosteroid isomerase-like protein
MGSIHKLDYEDVRDLIPDDGVYYGSVVAIARGYEELYEKQFSKVWPNVDEFNIVPISISVHNSGSIAWAICLFESSSAGVDGKTMERNGCMTFIFERRGEKWIMIHSHDSLYPTAPGQ